MNDDDQAIHVYQATVLRHARAPFGYGETLPGARAVTERNALCGDQVTVLLAWREGVAEVRFHCQSCLLCKASASVMATVLAGLTPEVAATLVAGWRSAFGGAGQELPPDTPSDLRALLDLRRYPTRERCVLLPWEALAQLL